MTSTTRKIVYTPKAPIMKGIYSQAVVVDRTMYISGQVGLDPATGQLVDGGVLAQTEQALVNMGEILKAAGCDYKNVVKTTVLLTDINDFAGVNDVYKQFFPNNCPARAAYQVVALPKVVYKNYNRLRVQWAFTQMNGLVEIEAVAVVGPLTEASE